VKACSINRWNAKKAYKNLLPQVFISAVTLICNYTLEKEAREGLF